MRGRIGSRRLPPAGCPQGPPVAPGPRASSLLIAGRRSSVSHRRADPTRRLRCRAMSDILVVADETWVLNDVRASLTEPRYTLHEVTDPREVVERLHEVAPEAVVVDLQVGSMGGMAITRAIRNGPGATAPVILLLDRDADAFLAGRSGAVAWVRKPFIAHDLRAAIDGAMQRSTA